MQKYAYFHVHSNIVTIEWVDDSLRTSQHGEASTSPKRTTTKLVALCARCGYKASFEACLMDLRNSRKCHGMVWFSINFHKTSPLGPIFGLAVVVPPQC